MIINVFYWYSLLFLKMKFVGVSILYDYFIGFTWLEISKDRVVRKTQG